MNFAENAGAICFRRVDRRFSQEMSRNGVDARISRAIAAVIPKMRIALENLALFPQVESTGVIVAFARRVMIFRSQGPLMRDLDTLEALLACTTPEELRRAVGEYVKNLGFDSWVYAANPKGQHAFPYVLSAFPPAWLERYIEKGYLGIDPVVAHCREHVTPLIWTADGPLGDRNQRCPAFFHDAADFGLKVGISTPVHGLGCQWGVLSVAGSDVKTDRRTQLEQLAGVQLLATFTHEVGHRFATTPQTGVSVHLTARELECLRWAAEGKTGWEIGRLLSISERTVVFHVENAAHKLGVFGRRQAVARAIALQLITL